MTENKKTLQIFGFGLSIIIPYLILMHYVKLGFFVAFGGLIVLLIVISKIDKLRILYYLLFAAICASFVKIGLSQQVNNISYFLFLISYFVLVISAFRHEWLAPVYRKWMHAAHFIGALFSGIILTIVFFLIFSVVGIILRLIRKDLLDQTIDLEKKSYWIKRQNIEFNKERYKQQF